MKKILKILFSSLLLILFITPNITTSVNAANPYIRSEKWKKSTLYYYFDNTPSVGNIPKDNYTYWNVEVPSSFNSWNSWLDMYSINIEFKKTSTRSNANIIVKYGNGPSWAHVDLVTSGGYITKATITLDDFAFYTNGFTDAFINSIIKHEIGHTLGLKDISVAKAKELDKESIMVNSLSSSWHSNYITYSFDRVNLLENY